jgi:hypothetical protein
MGEMLEDATLTAGFWAADCRTIVDWFMGSADGVSGDLSATTATSPMINRAAIGGSI